MEQDYTIDDYEQTLSSPEDAIIEYLDEKYAKYLH
jgi:hypothetical protein